MDASGGGGVLVVDDDDDVRETIRAVLIDEGYRVRTARDGEEALAAIAAEPPALLLLDMMMPRMTGRDVILRLQEETTLTFPVCLLTAAPGLDAVSGVDCVIGKPLAIDALLEIVERLHEELDASAPLRVAGARR
jgi:DNA-binding response OmpR family regulator